MARFANERRAGCIMRAASPFPRLRFFVYYWERVIPHTLESLSGTDGTVVSEAPKIHRPLADLVAFFGAPGEIAPVNRHLFGPQGWRTYRAGSRAHQERKVKWRRERKGDDGASG